MTLKGIFTIIAIFITGIGYAQDLIILNNNQRIEGKVVEVNESEIRFSKTASQDIYKISISKVYKIKYEDGSTKLFNYDKEIQNIENRELRIESKFLGFDYYDGYEKISKNDFIEKLNGNAEALNSFYGGRSLINIGNVIGIPSGFVFGYLLGKRIVSKNNRQSTTLTLVSGVVWLSSSILVYSGRIKLEKSLLKVNHANGLSSKITVGNHGLGYVLTFGN